MQKDTRAKPRAGWREAFESAILEADQAKIPQRVESAKKSVESRLRELKQDSPETRQERRALGNALQRLLRLGSAKAGSIKYACRICGREASLKTCKVDANGNIVHDRCYVGELLKSAAEQERLRSTKK